MKKKQINKKQQILFNLYAKNLALLKQHPNVQLVPDMDDVFLCPLCFTLFPRDALSFDTLSLEHIPPNALGGTNFECTLTCKRCNNQAGTKLESHLKARLKTEAAFARVPGVSIDIEYSPIITNDNSGKPVWLPATYESLSNRVNIMGDRSRSNPESFRKVRELLKVSENYHFPDNVDGFKFRVRGIRYGASEIALLKTAYLYVFSLLGYSALLPPSMQDVRKQIQNPTEKTLEGVWSKELPFTDRMLGVNVIREPFGLQSYLVVFDLDIGNTIRRFGVFLPKPADEKLQVYKKLETIQESNFPKLIYEHFNIQNVFKDPRFTLSSLTIWQENF